MTSYFSAKTDYDTSKNRFKLNELFSLKNEKDIYSITFTVKSVLPLNGRKFDQSKLKVSFPNIATNVQANKVDFKHEYVCTINYEKNMAEKILNNVEISYPHFSQISLEVTFKIYGLTSYSTKTKNISFVIANNFVKTKEKANELQVQNNSLSTEKNKLAKENAGLKENIDSLNSIIERKDKYISDKATQYEDDKKYLKIVHSKEIENLRTKIEKELIADLPDYFEYLLSTSSPLDKKNLFNPTKDKEIVAFDHWIKTHLMDELLRVTKTILDLKTQNNEKLTEIKNRFFSQHNDFKKVLYDNWRDRDGTIQKRIEDKEYNPFADLTDDEKKYLCHIFHEARDNSEKNDSYFKKNKITKEATKKTKLSSQTAEFLKQAQQLLKSKEYKMDSTYLDKATSILEEKNYVENPIFKNNNPDLAIKVKGKNFEIPNAVDMVVIYDATQCLDKNGNDLSAFWYDKKKQKALAPRKTHYMLVDYFKAHIEIKDGIGLTKVTSVTKKKEIKSEIGGFDIQKTNIGCKDIMTIAGVKKIDALTTKGDKKEFVYTTPGK